MRSVAAFLACIEQIIGNYMHTSDTSFTSYLWLFKAPNLRSLITCTNGVHEFPRLGCHISNAALEAKGVRYKISNRDASPLNMQFLFPSAGQWQSMNGNPTGV